MVTVNFELINKIRFHIGRTEKQAKLLENRKKWMQLTSALDVLEDTSWAIEYYIDEEYPADMRGKYLYTYGLLQALYVQQDAIKSVYMALYDEEIKLQERFPVVYGIREMRNDVAGHPTGRNGNVCMHLAQNSMTKYSFYYIREKDGQELGDVIDVNIQEAIDENAEFINSLLTRSIEQLNQEFENYINAHKGRKMKEIFNNLRYAREKVLLNTLMRDGQYLATKEMVKKCESELISRYGSVEAADAYKFLLEEIHELYALIDDGISQMPYDLQSATEKYLLQMLFYKLSELEQYCEETDAYFSNYGEDPVK